MGADGFGRFRDDFWTVFWTICMDLGLILRPGGCFRRLPDRYVLLLLILNACLGPASRESEADVD